VVNQQTIAEKVLCTGIGLHTGAPVQVTLLPARADSGIVFVRTDCAHPLEIPARPAAVISTKRATTLGRGGVTIATVEHLLAALYGLGIDNVRVEVDGGELPVMDGSAASFVYLVRSAGIFEQREPRCALRLRRPVEVLDGDRRISLAPSRTFQVTYAVDFDHPAIGRQEYRLGSFDPDGFERDLSAARTFGFLNDAEVLWNSGLGRGGSLQNTVVLDAQRVLNDGGLRWPDEFVRHKILDLLGDLALLGVPIQGHVRVERGGHSLHQRLLAALLENPDAWWIHDPDPASMAPIHLIPAERAA
jgi:UDP-3-O-[3-hydroxymyristoyl] N-acetylglucosamine deacetylase